MASFSSLPSSALSETTLQLLAPTIISTFKRDLYCWVCHMDGPLLKCKTCPRAYHRNCAHNLGSISPNTTPILDHVGPNPEIMKGCPECQMATKTVFSKMKEIPAKEVTQICIAIARNLRDGYFWPNPFYNIEAEKSPKEYQHYKDVVAKAVDIASLEEMAASKSFTTLEGFLGETKWILHNTVILHGKCSREADHAKEIIDICELELLAAELCPECFLKEQDRAKDDLWFVRACRRHPHPLGWAKTPSNPNWPVKIMQWIPGEDIVTVRSFADYRRFDIPASKCYLYTRHKLKFDAFEGSRAEDSKQAQKEIDLHLVELEKVMGKVRLPDKECRLSTLGSMDNTIRFMFPELQRVWCPVDDTAGIAENNSNTKLPLLPALRSKNHVDKDVANNNSKPVKGQTSSSISIKRTQSKRQRPAN